jgi:hypothetical protein
MIPQYRDDAIEYSSWKESRRPHLALRFEMLERTMISSVVAMTFAEAHLCLEYQSPTILRIIIPTTPVASPHVSTLRRN